MITYTLMKHYVLIHGMTKTITFIFFVKTVSSLIIKLIYLFLKIKNIIKDNKSLLSK